MEANTAIILAGGKSKRMGFDKQFLKINDRWIIDIQVNSLEKLFREIIIVTNKPEAYKKYPHKIVQDEITGLGPMGGIHSGLKNSSSYYNYVIACDMPCISMEYIKYMKKLIEEDKNTQAIVTKQGSHLEPMNAFYSKTLIEKIEDNIREEKRKISTLLNKSNVLYIEESKAREFSPQWDMFINLNKTEDFYNYILQNEMVI